MLGAALLAVCGGLRPLGAPPTVASVSPATFAVEGGDTAVVVGDFAGGGARGAVCRIDSPPTGGTTVRHGGYLCGKAVEHNVNCVGDHIDFAATLLNSTHLRCSPPPVVVGGAAALSVSLDNGSAWTFSDPLPIRLEPLVDAAIGRRPYLTEITGTILLALSPRLRGASLAVSAALPCAGEEASWNWSLTAKNLSVTLPFPLTDLPAAVNNDISITVTPAAPIPGRALSAPPLRTWRRFLRSAPPPAGSAVEAAQVDHHTRALRVNGSSFVGQGWFVYGSRTMTIDELFGPVQRQAGLVSTPCQPCRQLVSQRNPLLAGHQHDHAREYLQPSSASSCVEGGSGIRL